MRARRSRCGSSADPGPRSGCRAAWVHGRSFRSETLNGYSRLAPPARRSPDECEGRLSSAHMSEHQDALVCEVEIPKGGRNKYEYDPELGGIKFDRLLISAATYPPTTATFAARSARTGTRSMPRLPAGTTFPGCLIPVKPLGMFKMRDEKGIDDKIICVPLHDPYWNQHETSRICRCCCARRSNSSSRSTRIWKARRSRPTDGARSRRPGSTLQRRGSD